MLVVTLTLAALYGIFLVVIARRPALAKCPRWFKVTLALLLLVAIIARLYRYNSAMGIDYDEAMGGINAWSLAKWGIDYFTMASHPVYLYAWGSGMNLLYPPDRQPLGQSLGPFNHRLPLPNGLAGRLEPAVFDGGDAEGPLVELAPRLGFGGLGAEPGDDQHQPLGGRKQPFPGLVDDGDGDAPLVGNYQAGALLLPNQPPLGAGGLHLRQ